MNKRLCRTVTVVEYAVTSSADTVTLEAFFLFYMVDTLGAEREEVCVQWVMCLASSPGVALQVTLTWLSKCEEG